LKQLRTVVCDPDDNRYVATPGTKQVALQRGHRGLSSRYLSQLPTNMRQEWLQPRRALMLALQSVLRLVNCTGRVKRAQMDSVVDAGVESLQIALRDLWGVGPEGLAADTLLRRNATYAPNAVADMGSKPLTIKVPVGLGRVILGMDARVAELL